VRFQFFLKTAVSVSCRICGGWVSSCEAKYEESSLGEFGTCGSCVSLF